MSEPRDNLLIIVTGRKRVGKSYTSLKQLLFLAYKSKHPKKSLILDVNGEYGSYTIDNVVHHIKEIKETDLIKYSSSKIPEVRRIVPVKLSGMPMDENEIDELLIKVIKYFRNGVLFIDDLNVIMGDAMPVKFTSLLCNNAHRGADVILHLQSCGRLLPKLRQNCNIIRCHAQLDSLEDSKGKMPPSDYKILKITQLMIDKQVVGGNLRFFVNVNRDVMKIEGQFSPRMLSEAIKAFLLENPSLFMSAMKQLNEHGKKKFTYEQALNGKIIEYYHLYNGNVKK